jgi:putative SOS response-associated peptidase YedK
MCGRFTNRYTWRELVELYRLSDPGRLPNWPPRYNIAPTQEVPVVRRMGEERRADLLRWGLVPPWADDLKFGARCINARAETVQALPAFRNAFRHQRCLVVADGFYEWKTAGKTKQPYHVSLTEPFAFAGLWERWNKGSSPVETFAIVTTEAGPKLSAVHHRQPVMLLRDSFESWLDPTQEPAALLAMLGPTDDRLVVMREVSRTVNNVRNDDPSCLEAEASLGI